MKCPGRCGSVGWASSQTERSPVQFPARAHDWVGGLQEATDERFSHIDVFLHLLLPPLPPLW